MEEPNDIFGFANKPLLLNLWNIVCKIALPSSLLSPGFCKVFLTRLYSFVIKMSGIKT